MDIKEGTVIKTKYNVCHRFTNVFVVFCKPNTKIPPILNTFNADVKIRKNNTNKYRIQQQLILKYQNKNYTKIHKLLKYRILYKICTKPTNSSKIPNIKLPIANTNTTSKTQRVTNTKNKKKYF